MERIKDLDFYSELLKKAKKTKGAVNINCFLLPNDIQKAIDKGSIAFQEIDAGVCIYVNRKLYYQLYLIINPNMEFTLEKLDLSIVCEFPGINTLPDKCSKAIEILKNSGFVENAITKRMAMSYQPEISRMIDVSQFDYIIEDAKEHHVEAIINLWKQTFDPFINLLPDRNELLQEIAKENVLCAIDKEGELIGTLQGEFATGYALIWHQAVDSSRRGRKIGHALSQAYFDKAYQKGITKHLLWVVLENEGAINFHAKFGYEYDGKFSKQYILNND